MWIMKFKHRKNPSITISCSRTPHPPLTLCGIDMEVSSSLKLLGVTIDNKLTFEKQISNIASSIAQNTGLICKLYKTNTQILLCIYYLGMSTVLLSSVLHLPFNTFMNLMMISYLT